MRRQLVRVLRAVTAERCRTSHPACCHRIGVSLVQASRRLGLTTTSRLRCRGFARPSRSRARKVRGSALARVRRSVRRVGLFASSRQFACRQGSEFGGRSVETRWVRSRRRSRSVELLGASRREKHGHSSSSFIQQASFVRSSLSQQQGSVRLVFAQCREQAHEPSSSQPPIVVHGGSRELVT